VRTLEPNPPRRGNAAMLAEALVADLGDFVDQVDVEVDR
jgi:hypothetical protein